MSYTLRPRQKVAVDKIDNFITNSKKNHGIFVYPTSFGKSLVISNIASKYPEKYFINVTNSKELLKQNYEKYTSYGFEANICSASLGEVGVGKVTFATIGTVVKFADFFKDKDVIILDDECFPSNTPILTDEGLVKIGDLYKMYVKGIELPKAKSYNELTKKFEYKQILNVKHNGKKETIKLHFSPRTVLETTHNHEILTTNGWKHAENLRKGDAIITSFNTNHSGSYKYLNNDQFDFVIGSSLGDGSLRFENTLFNTTRISFTHGAAQKEYIEWKSEILNCEKALYKIDKNGYSEKEGYGLNSKKFYFEDKYKSIEDRINELNYKSLAVLWMDDGCLSSNMYGKLYALHDKKELVYKLQNKIESLGIPNTKVMETKSSSTGRKLWYISFRKDSIAKLFSNCAEFMHTSMSYKVSEKYKNLIGKYIWDNSEKTNIVIFKYSTEVKKAKNVYDMEVEENHNYIVSSNKSYQHNSQNIKNKKECSVEGLVVHNCQEGSASGSQLHSFVKQLKNYKLVGVTATPFRLSQGMEGTSLKMMNRDRKCIYKSIEDVVQISEVVEQNYWSKLIYDIKNVDEEDLKLNTSGTEFTDESVQKFKEVNDINNRLIEEIQDLISKGRKSILVSVPFISDAQEISSKLDVCKAVYSGMDTKDRDKIINDFKSLKLKVVVQCRILSVGFDHPELDAIIMAKPTNSLTFYYQYLGRGVRVHPNKKDCVVVDLSGNFRRFGKIETLSIENSDLTKGWAVFNEDMLLSNYPLNTNNRPTKKSLLAKLKREQDKTSLNEDDALFYFGKYKDKKVSDVMKENKSYLTWLLDQKDFNWYGENGRKLKQSIQKQLGVFLEDEKELVKSVFTFT